MSTLWLAYKRPVSIKETFRFFYCTLHTQWTLNRDNFNLYLSGLRKDYVSTPAAASPRRSPESPVMLPSYFNTTAENFDDFTPGNKTEASSSSGLQPGLSSLSSSSCQSPTSVAKQNCQSPKLARLQQQVTQFKLLKLAQNQGTQSMHSLTSTDIFYSVFINTLLYNQRPH